MTKHRHTAAELLHARGLVPELPTDGQRAPIIDDGLTPPLPASAAARRKQRVFNAYEDAAADPVFMAEMDETTGAFDITLGDWRRRRPS